MAETWLTPDILDSELTIPHFKLHRKDRLQQRGGGVGIYCHESVLARRRTDLETDLELLWIEVSVSSGIVLVGCCYRPPDKPVAFWTSLESNLDASVHAPGKKVLATVMLGDFNVDMKMNQSPMAIRVTDLFNKFGMTNYVSSPTRATTLTESIIDLFLSTCLLTGPCEIAYLDISDHFAVLGNLSVAGFAPGRTSSYRPTRRIHKINWDTFNSDLSVEQASLLAIDDVNTLASSFIASIVSTLDKHAPVRMRRNRDRRPCPWVYDDELVACVRERDRLHRLLMKNRCNDDLHSQHRTARAKTRKLDRSLKNTYFIQQCQTSDQRKLWSVINTVVGRKKQSHTAQVPISDLSKLFGDVVHDPQRPPQLCSPSGPMAEGAFTDFSVVTVEDVASSLKSVNPFKATGSDQVPSIILQKCYPTIAPKLTRIINISLSSGEFPLSFKLSHISPLFKSGDPTLPKNYRPVSLLPVISRITEVFVKNQITQYLDSKQLLPPTQFAYRKLHSTEDALTYAVDRWQMARAERKYTGIVFVDMSKAFDRSTMPPDVADQEFADDIALDCSNACPKQVCASLSSAVTNLAE
ncbi:uncharacterized protein LOC135816859 [Sycon ciliatum]|uniref:uncharacterized protein LOC135816859 n=1 Tax=Sycon ciliatum TaxID=27933 RepID=UPI0031F6EA25